MPDQATEPELPKNHKRRTVPIPRFIVDELAPFLASKSPSDLVFTNSAGGVLDNTNFRRNVYSPAVRALGLDPLTVHDLRHTTASLAVSAGANVKAVQRLLGHESAAVTLNLYAALFDDDLDRVAVRLNDAALRDQTGTNAA
jgi:integrase